jgi:hypothetical protein
VESNDVKGFLQAVKDHLIDIKGRVIRQLMKEGKRTFLDFDLRVDLFIILGRVNTSIRIIDDVLRWFE